MLHVKGDEPQDYNKEARWNGGSGVKWRQHALMNTTNGVVHSAEAHVYEPGALDMNHKEGGVNSECSGPGQPTNDGPTNATYSQDLPAPSTLVCRQRLEAGRLTKLARLPCDLWRGATPARDPVAGGRLAPAPMPNPMCGAGALRRRAPIPPTTDEPIWTCCCTTLGTHDGPLGSSTWQVQIAARPTARPTARWSLVCPAPLLRHRTRHEICIGASAGTWRNLRGVRTHKLVALSGAVGLLWRRPLLLCLCLCTGPNTVPTRNNARQPQLQMAASGGHDTCNAMHVDGVAAEVDQVRLGHGEEGRAGPRGGRQSLRPTCRCPAPETSPCPTSTASFASSTVEISIRCMGWPRCG